MAELLSQWVFQLLTDIAKLPFRRAQSVYTPSNRVGECLFLHNLVNTRHYQTFICFSNLIDKKKKWISSYFVLLGLRVRGNIFPHIYELFLSPLNTSYPLCGGDLVSLTVCIFILSFREVTRVMKIHEILVCPSRSLRARAETLKSPRKLGGDFSQQHFLPTGIPLTS